MKRKRVNPPYRPYSQGNPSQVMFQVIPLSPSAIIWPRALRRCFRRGCKAAWGCPRGKLRANILAISTPSWDFWSQEWSKNNLRGATLGIKPIWRTDNSFTLHPLLKLPIRTLSRCLVSFCVYFHPDPSCGMSPVYHIKLWLTVILHWAAMHTFQSCN